MESRKNKILVSATVTCDGLAACLRIIDLRKFIQVILLTWESDMDSMKADDIRWGKYQHYKTLKLYEVNDVALHSETKEEMIIYRALYDCEQFGNNRIWVRPKEMFFENVMHNGNVVPRFKFVGE